MTQEQEVKAYCDCILIAANKMRADYEQELTTLREIKVELERRNYAAKQLNIAHVETINSLRAEVERLTVACKTEQQYYVDHITAERSAIAEALIACFNLSNVVRLSDLADRILAGGFAKGGGR